MLASVALLVTVQAYDSFPLTPRVTAWRGTEIVAQQRPFRLPICSSTSMQDFDTTQLGSGLG